MCGFEMQAAMRFPYCALFAKPAAIAIFGVAILPTEVFAQDKSEQVAATPSVVPKPDAHALQKRLKSIVIPKVVIDKMDIKDVVQFLQTESKEFDPDKVGLNFVLRLTIPQEDAHLHIHREVSITLHNVPLDELLGFIVTQTNLEYSVGDDAVYIRPAMEDAENLTVRTCLAPANFLSMLPRVRGEAPKGEDGSVDVKPQLSALGFNLSGSNSPLLAAGFFIFPVGATATCLPGPSKLVIRNTPMQLDLIITFVGKLSTSRVPSDAINAGGFPDK